MNLSAFPKLNVKLPLTILDTNELTMRLNQNIVVLLLLFLSPFVLADMYVDRSIVIFEAETQPRQDIKVSNSGEEVMYVQVEVFQVNDPGESTEERIKVNDPKQIKLIATPNIRVMYIRKLNRSPLPYPDLLHISPMRLQTSNPHPP